jgi:hypothetical protein
MTAGGYRPGSGPLPGTKYRPRANKKAKIPKVPKKRGRPPKVKVEGVVPPVSIAPMAVQGVAEKIAKSVKVKKAIKSITIPPAEIIVVPIQEPIASQPTSLAPNDIVNAAAAVNLTPLDYLLSVMNNLTEDQNIRIRVAGMIAPFIHPKPGERTGKKDEKEEKAKSAFAGKFKAGRSPLTLVK